MILPRQLCLILVVGALRASNFNNLTPDQIVELWMPKREAVYLATQANFEPHAAFIFDLRRQNLVNDFDCLRHMPIAPQLDATPQSPIDDDDAYEDPFDGADLNFHPKKSKMAKIQAIIAWLSTKIFY